MRHEFRKPSRFVVGILALLPVLALGPALPRPGEATPAEQGSERVEEACESSLARALGVIHRISGSLAFVPTLLLQHDEACPARDTKVIEQTSPDRARLTLSLVQQGDCHVLAEMFARADCTDRVSENQARDVGDRIDLAQPGVRCLRVTCKAGARGRCKFTYSILWN